MIKNSLLNSSYKKTKGLYTTYTYYKYKMDKQMQEIRKRAKELRKPYVMIKEDMLYIIYKNKSVRFKKVEEYTKKQIDEENKDCIFDYENIYGVGWNKYHEEKILRDNGFKHVQLKEGENF